MKTTIKEQISFAKEMTENEVREALAYGKEEGVLFYFVDIRSIGTTDMFDIYYVEHSGKESKINPFPVPVNDYMKKQPIDLNQYYREYYKHRVTFSGNKNFEGYYIHKGKQFYWFYLDSKSL